jgi:hypothetical protein
MKRVLILSLALALGLALGVGASMALAKVERVAGPWMLNAPSPIVFGCGGGSYPHTLNTVNQTNGAFTGTGTYDPNAGYTWNITGSISGDDITFTIVYTGNNAGYTLNGTGTINLGGSIEGTTDGNCQTFDMPADSASRFEGNHGQYVKSQDDKNAAAQSRIGMPSQSKGHTK